MQNSIMAKFCTEACLSSDYLRDSSGPETPRRCLRCAGVPDLPLWRLCSTADPVRFETECEA